MKTQIVNGNGGMPVVEDNLQLFSRSPRKALSEMQELVKVMSDKSQGEEFIAIINNRKYPKVEWWTTVATTLGLFPFVVYSKRLNREDEIAYEARVEVRQGERVLGAGEAMCSNKESRWANVDEYAIRSMSITRATGKSYRIPLSFLAVMAGLNPTNAEEVPFDNGGDKMSIDRATDKQIDTLSSLLEHPLVNETEMKRLLELVNNDDLTRKEASSALEYFFGRSTRDPVTGKWIKDGYGILSQRKFDGLPD